MEGQDSNPDLTGAHPPIEVSSIPPGSQKPDKFDSTDADLGTPRSKGSWWLPAIAILVVLGALGWVLYTRLLLPMMMMRGGPGGPPATPVGLGQPKAGTVQDSSDYAATLDSRQSVRIQPRVGGQITAILVEAGDRVQAGQVLMQIDAAQQQAQVASREAATATAAADIATAQARVSSAAETLRSLEARRAAAAADVEFNRKEFERFTQLAQDGATSQQNADQRRNALQTAEATLREAEADIAAQRSAISEAQSNVARSQRALEQAQANVSEVQAQLQDFTVVSPVSGIVGDIPAKVGDVVSNTTALLTVNQNDRLEVQIQIPLEEADKLRPGLPVRLLDNRNQPMQTGRISFIAPDVDPATQSIQAKASFDNAGNLRTAQFIRARVIWDQGQGLLVPTSAISRLAGRNFIFVATPFQSSQCGSGNAGAAPPGAPAPDPEQLVAVQKPIELGKIIGNDQEVIEGLSEGDRIVTSGILQLQNCAPIMDAAQMQQPQ
jgi:multidrug efflux pump subunit AcrA (membrane-fusion protein)